ncbi:MAG: pilus assembly PilX N-terminal domain-containing protein [Deltaproteobacteria bacterium]|nr:pilus assembly PilX N-terminal domain-containing protein [Candidatus Zymogenaceae bacterium]
MFKFKNMKSLKVYRGEKGGYIMMLALIIMLTLTVIAVGYVANVTLETSITRNYRVNRDILNAAEAGLGVAMRITHEEILNQLEPFSGTARTEYEGDNESTYGYPFQVLFDDYKDVRVKYRVIPENPDPQKNRFLYRTYVSCSEMIHYAYPYIIEVLAEPLNGVGGTQYLKRQIRVLETPLVQYFVFFDDDLPWHPGPVMNSWGRIHSNGNIWFSPEPSGAIYLKNLTSGSVMVEHFLTASGVIYQDRVLGMIPTETRGGHVYMRVYHLTSTADNQCLYSGSTSCDYVEINTDINSANADTQQTRFTDANGCSYVMVGVPKSPSISFNATFREGFYESRARAPERSEYFGLTIVIEGSGGGNWPPRNAATDVTGTLHIYAATKDFAYDYKSYPDGVKIEDVTDKVFLAGSDIPCDLAGWPATDGDIVFSPETIRNPLTPPPAFPDTNGNPTYPVYLERNDQRQDMNGVALTVIDLERLEKWFYSEYLDSEYDNQDNNQTIDKFQTDEVTGNTTKLVIYVSRTPTAAEVPGWAGYTVDGGPPYPYYDTPASQVLQAIKIWHSDELVCPTTIATDNPVYIEGDFNKGGSYAVRGCAVIADLVTLLSKDWHTDLLGKIEGRPPVAKTLWLTVPVATTYNAAFFIGRDDLNTFAIRGGPFNDETEGLHNFVGFGEDWSNGSKVCTINGSFINLWFTRQALGYFDVAATGVDRVYTPPTRNFGWDPGYKDSQFWPPYCPSAYSVEKVGWYQGEEYDEEYMQDPNEE